jgi:hypothetical protein
MRPDSSYPRRKSSKWTYSGTTGRFAMPQHITRRQVRALVYPLGDIKGADANPSPIPRNPALCCRSYRGSGSTGRRWLGGQGAGNDRFPLRVHAVAKRVESEAVRTGGAGFHQTRCEIGYVINPCSSTPIQDRRPRLGSGLRSRGLLIELLVGCHYAGYDARRFQK